MRKKMEARAAIAAALCLLLAPAAAGSMAMGINAFNGGSTFGDYWVAGWVALGSNTGRETFFGVLIFILVMIGLLFIYFGRRQKERTVHNGVLGDAKLIKSRSELRDKNDIWYGKWQPETAGLVLGYDGNVFYYDHFNAHALIVATTGSGKSRIIALPTIDLISEAGKNLVITDLKGELEELTAGELKARGYELFRLNLVDPLQGDRYNPIELVLYYGDPNNGTGDIARAVQAANELSEIIIPDDNSNASRIWTDAPRAILTGVILYIVLNTEIPRELKTMLSVVRMITEGSIGEGTDPCEPLKNIFRKLPSGHPAKDAFSVFLSSQGQEQSGILSTLKTHVRLFTDPNIAWLCSTSDVDIFNLMKSKTAVFLRITPSVSSGGGYNKILAVFLAQYYQAADTVKNYYGGKLPRETYVIADEFGTLPKVENFTGAMAIARSMGLHYFIFVQMLSQLREKYGENGANIISGNCTIKVAMKLANLEDANYFSREIGDITVRTEGTSNHKRDFFRNDGSLSYQETSRQLIKPEQWTERSPLRDGLIVIKSADNDVPERAGKFCFPCADATETPTMYHFDLGSREHERNRQQVYQEQRREVERRNKNHINTVVAWSPDFEDKSEEERKKPAASAQLSSDNDGVDVWGFLEES